MRRAMMDTTALTLILSPDGSGHCSTSQASALGEEAQPGRLFSPAINFNESEISTSIDASRSNSGSRVDHLENEIDRLKAIISEINEVHFLRTENEKLKQTETKLKKTLIENEKLRAVNSRLSETHAQYNELLDDFGLGIGVASTVANTVTKEKFIDENLIFYMIKNDDFKGVVEKINSNTFKQLHKQYHFR